MSDPRQRSRLGRGLSSLISMPVFESTPGVAVAEAPAPAANPAVSSNLSTPPAATSIFAGAAGEIAVDQIVPNPHQPRRTINPAAIAELAASLKSNGVIQPIVVRRVAQGYELIAGERRWRAAQQAGLKSIPAVVKEVDRFAQAQMALVENIQREDLNPMDRAAGYRTLIEKLNLTQAELALRLGEERSTIANHLRLLELPETIRNWVKDGKISLGHAKLLAGVSNVAEQEHLAKLVLAKEISVRELERQIESRAAASKKTKAGASAAYYNDLEKSLARQIGLRVNVKASAKKGQGRIVIHYATLEQFDQLMTRMGVKMETEAN